MKRSSQILAACIGTASVVAIAPGVLRAIGGPQGFPKPALPTEPVEVRGVVSVTHVPPVDARQAGPWTVSAAQAGPWAVRVADVVSTARAVPSFLQPQRAYRFRWPDGTSERYRVLEVTPDGWLWVEPIEGTPPPRRWINPAQAVAIMP